MSKFPRLRHIRPMSESQASLLREIKEGGPSPQSLHSDDVRQCRDHGWLEFTGKYTRLQEPLEQISELGIQALAAFDDGVDTRLYSARIRLLPKDPVYSDPEHEEKDAEVVEGAAKAVRARVDDLLTLPVDELYRMAAAIETLIEKTKERDRRNVLFACEAIANEFDFDLQELVINKYLARSTNEKFPLFLTNADTDQRAEIYYGKGWKCVDTMPTSGQIECLTVQGLLRRIDASRSRSKPRESDINGPRRMAVSTRTGTLQAVAWRPCRGSAPTSPVKRKNSPEPIVPVQDQGS